MIIDTLGIFKEIKEESGQTVGEDTRYWFDNKGRYHREDGPAVEWANGNKAWYRNGKQHREDGPAIEC